ncbi:hypothetical protein A3C89_02410 [Candidatus Kaiserbacteria bacterium RIFCSPHIGHO2_02_FULL_50_50]|uniref:Band 7 domain-containing protein n=1 Tax=Candidatus Kaiserbacteria bacterium RIFCSPHIGHO2_02_FULL_50_50 TaxID=1798492 RepID=A0A1F6DD59_9BACT|nr:MAG: hypothetical protein A3C89_02410 [Candidatus Kaiserbacteria bacterium RIFCSPHIGHO2_02_FULL_50_50]OGG88201.1 MAG: hypothetical protein A3G62_00395 [Candidatus Kaiserbacteria bacterium RIFCSPLOWO2_12_FULL_50_10]
MSYSDRNESSFWVSYKKPIIVAWILFFSVIFLLAVLKRVQIEAGHEGVIVDKPFFTFFENGGVRSEPLDAGSKWLFYTSDVIMYDIRPVQHNEAFDDVRDGTITSDNIPIDFNAYIKVRPISGKTPKLHSSFGPHWYEQNIKELFRTSVRDEVSKTSMTALTTRQLNKDGKDILGEIQRVVLGEMREFVKAKSIDVEVMEVIVGKATPPEKVLEAMAETASQQQRSKTENERMAAEINRRGAEVERANADNAYRNSVGFSPEQFLKLEVAKKQVEAVQACAAKANCTTIIGDIGSQATIPLK